MSRPLPLHVTLGQLAQDSRETIAAKVLSFDCVKEAATKAALQGMTNVTIQLGPVSLERTVSAYRLYAELKGFTFEWFESHTRDGEPQWQLRLIWALAEIKNP